MKFNYRQLLAEVNNRTKFSISKENSQFVAYKDLAELGLIKLEQIKDTGVYLVSKK